MVLRDRKPDSQAATGRTAIHIVCLLLLLVTTGRLFALNVQQMKDARTTEKRTSYIPLFGSLSGIDANGVARRAEFKETAHLVMFVLRSDRIASDTAYWNNVITRLRERAPRIEFWGVCDSGTACDVEQGRASFRIIGFLDAYQMRVLVNSHSRGDALLYDKRPTIIARLSATWDPVTMAKSIENGARQ